jgi:hypothetical protein
MAGSVYDCSSAALDVAHVQAGLSQVKKAVGAGAYAYPAMIMHDLAEATFIESRETDRRFQTITDNKRGVSEFAYVHRNDTVKIVASEFCNPYRIWFLPEARASKEKVLELWGSDMQVVKPGGAGSEFMLKVGVASSSHARAIMSYLHGFVVLINKHPKACLSVRGFSL